jgi:hypothetical protein
VRAHHQEFEIRLRSASTGLNGNKPLPGMYIRATVDGRELHPSTMKQSYPSTAFTELMTMENKEVFASNLAFATLVSATRRGCGGLADTGA